MDIKKLKILDGSILKLIAVVTMFIDHFGLIFYQTNFLNLPFLSFGGKEITLYFIMRKIGRLAFPIFCFLIVEGFVHTKNLKKYLINLSVFAVISEIPFDLMISGNAFYLGKQNIYFTLLLGVLALTVAENIKSDFKKFLILAVLIAATIILKVDYGLNGVLLILLIYALRDKNVLKTVLSFPFLSGGYAAWAAFIPINMYNGKRGFIKGKFLKYFFYAFYPLHIIILLLIKNLI